MSVCRLWVSKQGDRQGKAVVKSQRFQGSRPADTRAGHAMQGPVALGNSSPKSSMSLSASGMFACGQPSCAAQPAEPSLLCHSTTPSPCHDGTVSRVMRTRSANSDEPTAALLPKACVTIASWHRSSILCRSKASRSTRRSTTDSDILKNLQGQRHQAPTKRHATGTTAGHRRRTLIASVIAITPHGRASSKTECSSMYTRLLGSHSEEAMAKSVIRP